MKQDRLLGSANVRLFEEASAATRVLALLSLLWLASLPCIGQEMVRPLVAKEFGKPVVVKAEFVAKSNTYYDENIVKEPFRLKVISVDGQKLEQEIEIQYKFEAEANEANEVKAIERAGVIVELEAYETLYQSAFSTPWLGKGQQGMHFSLMHILHVRPMKKRN